MTTLRAGLFVLMVLLGVRSAWAGAAPKPVAIEVVDAKGGVVAEGAGSLTLERIYKQGDTIRISGPPHMAVRLDAELAECLVYAPEGRLVYPVPTGRARRPYSPRSFAGARHTIAARTATAAELAERRNLAVNPFDVRGDTTFFPHATSNSECRNESVFAARNAIDGHAKNDRHGGWPNQSWGPDKRRDLWWRVDFGRAVLVDSVVLVIRADFPHDRHWHSGAIEFSDGTREAIRIEKQAEPQKLAFSKRKVSWVRITDLKQAEPLGWCAFTEVEVWGTDAPPAAGNAGARPMTQAIDWSAIRSPILLKGDATTACRDPAAIYHDGTFRIYYTLCRKEADGNFYWYTAESTSRDLVRWTSPRILTPRDRSLNFSSPGNVVRFGGKWVLCLQTYPTPKGEVFGNPTARVWIMRSDDLETWSKPELLRVKGPDVPVDRMGRMIDPYLLEDKDEPGKWWCFYKQTGMSMSSSHDLRTWTYVGHHRVGENVCVLVDGDEYVLFHSPGNGVGVKRSSDLKTWRDAGLLTLGQKQWPWAQGRLTAGFVLDLRKDPRVGKCVMFFHGSSREGLAMHRAHGHGSLALAWSGDLVHWHWPGKRP